MANLDSKDIDAVCGLVDDLAGICWDESKAYLIESRLQELVKQEGCENYQALVRKVRAEVVPGLKEQVLDAVTTNETLWFRDSSPFEAMKHKLLPELLDNKANSPFPQRLRIWSAACSTGQEVYSIAMTFGPNHSGLSQLGYPGARDRHFACRRRARPQWHVLQPASKSAAAWTRIIYESTFVKQGETLAGCGRPACDVLVPPT